MMTMMKSLEKSKKIKNKPKKVSIKKTAQETDPMRLSYY